MFFYLSFLRPPPIQAPLHGTISITPQISNDLRTEHFEGTQDIYYSWTPGSTFDPTLQPSKPTKLTTWRPTSAYKDIPVPIPSNVREGQRWRLILTCRAQGYGISNPESIDLRDPDVGSMPLPVMSMPVLFSSKAKREGKEKQEMIERIYLLPSRTPSQDNNVDETLAFLRFTEKTSYDLDKKIWDSGIGLSSWICNLKENVALSKDNQNLTELRSTLFSNERCRILELGAGVGMVSVVLGVLRCGSLSNAPFGDLILATDVSTAMPLLDQNISANSHYSPSATFRALVLDWDDEELPTEVKDLGALDIILMADVAYNTSSFLALSRTLLKLTRLGSKPPIILLGYKERDEAERAFWTMAAQGDISFEKVGERKGGGGVPVEIWLGMRSMG